MPLVLVQSGQLRYLQAVIDGLTLSVFPFQNDRTPRVTDTVDMYVEASFSGYAGALPLSTWAIPSLRNGRAVSNAPPSIWNHNGGPIDNNLFGICIVDELNNLLLVERDSRAPVLIRPVNPSYSYQGVLTCAAEFTG